MPAGGRGRRNFAAANARNFTQPVYRRLTLARDPEKWEPVFGKDHAPDLSAGDVFFDEVGMLQAGEFDGETVLDMAATRPVALPMVTIAPTTGRSSGEMATAAPDSDKSIMRQVTLLPFGRISRAIALRGIKRPWRRSSGRLRIFRLASQVSWAASLSRLRKVASTVMAKPVSSKRAILPSSRPR